MDFISKSPTLNEAWQLLVFEGAQTAIFLYGIYVHFFISAIHNLSHLRTAGKAILVGASWAMLLFGTTQIALHLVLTTLSLRLTRQLVQAGSIPTAGGQDNVRTSVVAYNTLVLASDVIFALNNLSTDLLFLFRCYVIWDFRIKAILLPAALIVSTIVLAVFKATAVNLFYSRLREVLVMAAVTNLVLTVLTAGRIWWIKRNAAHVGLHARFRSRYNTALAIIIESGTMYCICGILVLTTIEIEPFASSIIYGIAVAITFQGVNMIPTLSLVRGTRSAAQSQTSPSSNRPIPLTGRNKAADVEFGQGGPLEISQVIDIKSMEDNI
ncbi:hypothetical protein B0H11DRAFT_2038038 [Mycena galericulata]|nr:hypothetical protein B0H11DRAFT_2038038 [Mycena galericulata]